jgi:ABC-type molybdate transport system ATPase subunit
VASGLDVDVRLRLGSLSLAVAWQTRARTVALTGPSGSGKSTILRILAGLEQRAVGRIRFDGTTWQDAGVHVPPHDRRVGWVPQDGCLFPHLSVRGNLAYAGAPDAEVRALADRLGIGALLDRRPRNLSGGERQRVALGRALLSRPRLLLLDEPFEGVDPISARTMRAMLDRFRTGGGTVVLSSHVMDLVERLCDHVGVIHLGRVVAVGPTAELRGGRRLEDAFVDVVGERTVDDDALAWLA